MGAPYGINTAPDGSIYGSILGFPGGVIRFDPKTQLSEYYEVPYKNPKNRDVGLLARAAWASPATAWCGWRWPAAMRRVSTAGCARVR